MKEMKINASQWDISDESELLTRKQTAILLQINLSTLYYWTKSGRLKAYGISNRVYYKRSEVLDSLKPLN